ncbi:DNA alkylation repair protein [bacterium]|nr:DNA alkylation repair protein [bacterium]
MKPTAKQAAQALRKHADPVKAKVLQGFFKTGPGEYGEGDVFIGVVVPNTRRVAKEFRDLPLPEIKTLLGSKVHEDRLLALVILVLQFEKSDAKGRQQIYDFYLKNTARINNWDLVDVTCAQIVGAHLFDKSRATLHRLAKSKQLWERRIAIVSTFHFIRRDDFSDCLRLCEALLEDEHDLMHKACGWMLREVGKRDSVELLGFIDRHGPRMPRTMLRYAIERLPVSRRKEILQRPRAPKI